MCKRRGCGSTNFKPAQPPLENRWVWCRGCQDFSEMEKYEEDDFTKHDPPEDAKAPSRKVTKQGDKKKQSKEDKEAEKKRQEVDNKVANLRKKKKKKKKKELLSCDERGCEYEGTKRGLSIHVTKTHLQKCDVEDCEFETTSAQGFSLHTTKMHPDKPPCSEHPWYTAQRKPRSGCDTCMKAYEKNN